MLTDISLTSYADVQAKALNTPSTAGQPTGQPQQFTLTSPNDPQPVTLSSSPYNQSGVGTLPAGQNVVKDVTNTALTNGNLGASLVNQQAQAAAVPVNSSQMTALQSLQNQPGMTAEKYYAALAADPAYAAAGNSGIAALAAQKNQPAPIVLPAPQGKPQTFTLT